MKKSYRVDGMTCGGCAAALTRAIQALQPDAKVEVDLPAKRVTVEGMEDESALARAVAEAGFQFGGPV